MQWISFQGDELHSEARLLAAEHAAIKEVFELGLMVGSLF